MNFIVDVDDLTLFTKRDTQKWLNGEVMGNLFALKRGLTFIL